MFIVHNFSFTSNFDKYGINSSCFCLSTVVFTAKLYPLKLLLSHNEKHSNSSDTNRSIMINFQRNVHNFKNCVEI